jgi:two-component system phosphate regulon sensor histidine kinase PhoR
MINPRSIALFTGLLIASISTAFVWLVGPVSSQLLLVFWLITFASSFLLLRVILETLFFRHINTIYELLGQIQNNDLKLNLRTRGSSMNPLKDIKTEIRSYALSKQEEIERLTQLESFRREFIADISHELKTPLFAAQGFVHTLLDGAVKDKKVRDKFLKKAARSLDGLDMLVQDLLIISQMETGDIKMHFESFDIISLTEQVLDQMESKAEKRDITLKLENSPKMKIVVHADFQRIFQVMTNLVSNAIKYAKRDTTVTIRFTEKPINIHCEVIDQGEGIAPEHIGRIFERFYRVDKSRSKESGGTGLGLAIVKHIMEGHGSVVKVKSEVNKGSTFSFDLIKGSPVALAGEEDDDD